MNRRERRAAQKRGQGVGPQGIRKPVPPLPPAEIARMFAEAVGYRQNGALVEAEAYLQQHSRRQSQSCGQSVYARHDRHAGRAAPISRSNGSARRSRRITGTRPTTTRWGLRCRRLAGLLKRSRAIAARSASSRTTAGDTTISRSRCRRRAILPRLPRNSCGRSSLAPEQFEVYANICASLFRLNPTVEAGVARAAHAWPRRLPIEDLVRAGRIFGDVGRSVSALCPGVCAGTQHHARTHADKRSLRTAQIRDGCERRRRGRERFEFSLRAGAPVFHQRVHIRNDARGSGRRRAAQAIAGRGDRGEGRGAAAHARGGRELRCARHDRQCGGAARSDTGPRRSTNY